MARVPALSTEFVKQNHDTRGFVVLPRRWVGRRIARRLNIDGDGQGDLAGHGGEHRAVFVYQINSYRYWQAQLGRSDFSYGQFGENFTVDGLSDGEVCIGDRFRIGRSFGSMVRGTYHAR